MKNMKKSKIDNDLQKLILEVNSLENKRSKNEYDSEGLSSKIKKVISDIECNRNHSWAVEMFERNKNNLDKVALKYRGNKITYGEMFVNSYQYAKSLKRMGFNKNSEIPICITNTPEFIYMLIATILIGARVNIVSDWFAKDYLIQIFNDTKSDTIFIDDISYPLIKESINESNIKNIVCFSITDSLKNDYNPYQNIDNLFHEFKNNVSFVKDDFCGSVLNSNEFVNIGSNYDGKIVESVDLDDICSITYTSGTTKPGYPKGVKQSNRSYITLSRFKESDVSGMPTMKNMSVLAHIPTDTHMELSCAISDTLYCGCELDLEPFYSNEWFPYSLIINKPNFVPASAGFWGKLCNKLNFDPIFKNINMPFLMIPTVTGEGLSEGEEKYFNQTSRKHKFGIDKLPFPLSPVTFSIGGGTTESSGIFVTLYKSLQEKKLNHLIKKEKLGLTPHKFVSFAILDENGNHCKANQPGLLVANSPCEMIGYTSDELNKNTHVIDSNGKKWLSLGTYSYMDSTGRVKMKGRMGSYETLSDGNKLPHYYIEDVVLVDTKNVMSCSTIKSEDDHLICHIELQPFRQKSEIESLKGIIGRIDSKIPDEIKEKLFIRVRDNSESFPLDPSGKRSISTLKRIGIDEKTVLYSDFKSNIMNKTNNKTLKLEKN
jgi:long-chain acyl-CoA synthetase